MPGSESLRVTETPSLKRDGTQPDLLFVYGNLMRGLELHNYLGSAFFIAEAWTKGQLASLGRYPGLIEGEGKVIGEIYRLADPAADLERLDDLEEFDPADPDGSVYLRVRAEAQTPEGVLDVWLYRYNEDTTQAPRVPSGDWRSFLQR